MSGRYDKCETLTQPRADGTSVTYKALRILPQGSSIASGAATTVRADEHDRIDLVAYRTLRNAALGWQIADANDAMDPLRLTWPRTLLQLPAGTIT